MKNNLFKENIDEINVNNNKQKLHKYIELLSLYLDNIHDIKETPNEQKIKDIYYNSYFIIINSINLFNTEYWDEMNQPLKKAAESLEILSKLDNIPELNKDELLFDSILIYSISNYTSRAYVLTKENKNLSLPKYKEVVFQFMNRDLLNLRENLFNLLNSEECNENILIEKYKSNQITKVEALEFMLSYSIFKSVNDVLNYIYTGKFEFIKNSLELLEKYASMALAYGFIEYSWIIDILKIMIEELYKNSLWNQLKYFNEKNDFNPKLKQYILNYTTSNNPILELWPSQLKAMPKIIKGNNFTVKMPTSAGKTLVAELSILKYLIDTKFMGKIVYLSPFKSLSTELEMKFKKSLGKIGVNVSEFYGNFDFDPFGKKILDNYDLFILTPEKFDSILRSQNDFKNNIGLIIIDEGHIIAENNKRGLKFELFVTRLKKIFKNSRFIFISGVLPNMADFTKWLTHNEEEYVESEWKPSDVLVGTLTWNKNRAYINYFNGNIHKSLKFMNNIFDDKDSPIFPKRRNEALALSALKFANDGQTFIFSPKKDHIKSVANAIIKMNSKLTDESSNLKLKIDNEDKDIKYLKEVIINELGPNDELLKYLKCGFLIHHQSLPENIKIIIEKILRKNKIKLVIGTDTISQGVNFPIKTVLIKSIYRYPKKINEQTIHNIIGRAGRANEKNIGRVLLVIDLNYNSNQKTEFKKLVYGKKRLESSLNNILQKFKVKFKDSKLDFEEFCLYLAEKTSDKDLKELIDSLDIEVFSFIEENKELDDYELLELIIKYSLYYAQFPDNTNELKLLLKSRIHFLKNKYVKKNRAKMYKLGFNLPDCETIENNYQYLNNLFYLFEEWSELENNSKINLLYRVADFFFKKNIYQSNMYYEKSFELFDEKILEYWIKGLTNYKISKKMSINIQTISSLINSFKSTLPWLISNTLIFLKDQNENNRLKPLPGICEYIPTMFQYGIFDLKMSMLLYEYNDLELCKKLSEFIGNDENYTFEELFFKIEDLKWDFPFEINEEESYIRNSPNTFSNNSSLKLKVFYLKNSPLKEDDIVILKNEDEKVSIYNIDSTPIETVDKKYFELNNISFEEIKINNLWNIKIKDGFYLFKKL